MKKNIMSLLLALGLCLSLLPTAVLADETPPLCDVYQGDGFYITAKPYKLNSTKYALIGSNAEGCRTFYDGYLVVTSADVDENYVNRRFMQKFNLADKEGNIVLPEGKMHYWDGILTYLKSGQLVPFDGLAPFWDGETMTPGALGVPLMGFMDYQGNEVIPCQFRYDQIYHFQDGFAWVEVTAEKESGRSYSYDAIIDKTGREVITTREVDDGDKWQQTLFNSDYFGSGLLSAKIIDYDANTVTYGYINGQGDMALPLVTMDKDVQESILRSSTDDYWTAYAEGGKIDGYLLPWGNAWSRFSDDGYAVVADLRSSDELAYAYAIIDTSGNVVSAFRDMRPHKGGFHDGLMYVDFIDNRGNVENRGYIDTTGSVVWRESEDLRGGRDYSCGVMVMNYNIVVDKKGEPVIPKGIFEEIAPFQNDLSLAYVGGQPYVLELHQGAYTGSGMVYNHAKGGVTAEPTTPTQPEQPQQPVAPGNLAYASTQKVLVDGKAVEFQCYALKDAEGNDTNYIKLRDIAAVLNGTSVQFHVGWNGAVNIETGKAYTPNGSEMHTPFSGNRVYSPATAPTNVNSQGSDLEAIVLNDDNGGAYTYYKLRDLGKALGFNIGWAAETGVFVETDKPYEG